MHAQSSPKPLSCYAQIPSDTAKSFWINQAAPGWVQLHLIWQDILFQKSKLCLLCRIKNVFLSCEIYYYRALRSTLGTRQFVSSRFICSCRYVWPPSHCWNRFPAGQGQSQRLIWIAACLRQWLITCGAFALYTKYEMKSLLHRQVRDTIVNMNLA